MFHDQWGVTFVCLNMGILGFLGLWALLRIVFDFEDEPSPPDKEILFEDEFRGEV